MPRVTEGSPTRIGRTMAASRPVSPLPSPSSSSAEVDELKAEIERLQALVGPSEDSYEKLRLDVLGARDAARAAEIQNGVLRARVLQLEVAITGYERDFEWFRHNAIRRLQGLRRHVPTLRGLVRRAARR